MTGKNIFSGILATALVFVMSSVAFAGGATENEVGGSTFSFNSVQLYRATGRAYPGDGGVEQVEGYMNCSGSAYDGPSIGNIGLVSVDGKLTLTLPESIDDSKLEARGNNPNEKIGILATFPPIELCLRTDLSRGTMLVYANGNFSWMGIQLRKGWNLISSDDRVITNINDYVWVYSLWKPDF